MSKLILADCMKVLGETENESVDLVYIDPPFGTGSTQQLRSQYQGVVVSTLGYSDPILNDWLTLITPVLVEIHRVLKKDGSLYLHLDYHSVHYARIILDEIFGIKNFLNEIIWAYDYGGRPRDSWPKKHDNILWYAKGKSWKFNRMDIDRIPYMAPGLVGPEKAALGKLPTDTWWMTIVPTQGTERTGYPNQKPEKLLERIIRASSNKGDLVADFFCGSGTTGVVAKRLRRRYLLCDNNPIAFDVARKRLGI